MAEKKLLIEQYELPQLDCKRWGTNKGFTRTELLRGMLWNVFSKYIRHRDEGKCISCGEWKNFADLQAGHFAPVGGTSVDLWFDEKNVNGECSTCNADFEGWHLVPMRKNLVNKYSETIVQEIEKKKQQKLSVKWEERQYVDLIKYYYAKVQEYEKN